LKTRIPGGKRLKKKAKFKRKRKSLDKLSRRTKSSAIKRSVLPSNNHHTHRNLKMTNGELKKLLRKVLLRTK
jgi:hypothetical protein